jgi:Rer1 family
VATFFAVFDVPVFWPILLLYWVVLFVLTMKRQIKHMIKYKYVPLSLGKKVSSRLADLSLFYTCCIPNSAVFDHTFLC